MDETWLPTIYEGYEVSDQGRMRSYWTQGGKLAESSHVIRSRPLRSGHHMLTLRGRVNVYVHHLVAEAFIGPRPDGHEVCHGNSDPADNRLDNLRYDTPKGNAGDRISNGTQTAGEGNGYAKLTLSAVRALRMAARGDARARAVVCRELAMPLGVTPMCVDSVLRGRSWADPDGPLPPW